MRTEGEHHVKAESSNGVGFWVHAMVPTGGPPCPHAFNYQHRRGAFRRGRGLYRGMVGRCGPCRIESRINIMPNVPAFNSKKESFHHDNSNCGLGTRIPPHNRAVGAAGKPLCKNCKKLDREGK
jgi:hypothetical protein